MLLLAAADRPSPDRADGRRHDAGRRSVRQGRKPRASSPTRQIDEQSRRHPRDLRQIPEIRRRPGDAIMANNADWLEHAQLHRLPARRRAAFLGQPHARVRLGEAAARAPAGAVVPRIQLHDPAGLRFRRALQAPRLRAADGRLRPVGQHRQRHRSRPAHAQRAAVRADRAADHDLLRRQDGQDRGRRGVAQCRPGEPVRVLAILAQHRGRRRRALPQAVHRAAARRDRRLAALKGQEINEAKKMLATEATALVHGREAAEQAAETARRTFEEGALAETLPTVEIPARGARSRSRRAHRLRARPASSSSNGEARRQIKGGGLKVNDVARHRREDGARRRAISRRRA